MAPIRTVRGLQSSFVDERLTKLSNGHASSASWRLKQLKFTLGNRSTPSSIVSRIDDFRSSSSHSRAVGTAYRQKKQIKAYEILGSALDPSAQLTERQLTVKELLSPLSREQLGIVRCLGLNYSDHAVRNLVKILRFMR